MDTRRRLALIINKGIKVSKDNINLLTEDIKLNPIDKSILNELKINKRQFIYQRLQVFKDVYQDSKKLTPKLQLKKVSVRFLWSYIFPLAQYLIELYKRKKKPLIIGVSGRGTNAGKTTLINFLKVCIEKLSKKNGSNLKVLCISMDDFYITKQRRIEMGFKWRGLAGTHDTKLGFRVLSSIKKGQRVINIPRFDKGLDDRAGFEQVHGSTDICLIDSICADNHCLGQDKINQMVDFLIFLDMSVDALKKNRFKREKMIRKETGKGFDNRTMAKFWKEVAEPNDRNYFAPMMKKADMIIKLSSDHRPLNIELKSSRGV